MIKKLITRTITLFVLTLPIVIQSTCSYSFADEPEFIISTDKPSYKMLEDIDVNLTFRNATNKTLEFYEIHTDFHGGYNNCPLKFEVMDDKGVTVHYKGLWIDLLKPEPGTCVKCDKPHYYEPGWEINYKINKFINEQYRIIDPGTYTIQARFYDCSYYRCPDVTCPVYNGKTLKSNVLTIKVEDTNKTFEQTIDTTRYRGTYNNRIEEKRKYRIRMYEYQDKASVLFDQLDSENGKKIMIDEAVGNPKPLVMVDYQGSLFMLVFKKQSLADDSMAEFYACDIYSTKYGFEKERRYDFLTDKIKLDLEKDEKGQVYAVFNYNEDGEIETQKYMLSERLIDKNSIKVKKKMQPSFNKHKRERGGLRTKRSTGPKEYGEQINDLRISLRSYYSVHEPWDLVELTAAFKNNNKDLKRKVLLEAGNPNKIYKIIVTDNNGKGVNIPPEAWTYKPGPNKSGATRMEEIKPGFRTLQKFYLLEPHKIIKPGKYKMKIQWLDWKDSEGNPITSNEVEIEFLDYK